MKAKPSKKGRGRTDPPLLGCGLRGDCRAVVYVWIAGEVVKPESGISYLLLPFIAYINFGF